MRHFYMSISKCLFIFFQNNSIKEPSGPEYTGKGKSKLSVMTYNEFMATSCTQDLNGFANDNPCYSMENIEEKL